MRSVCIIVQLLLFFTASGAGVLTGTVNDTLGHPVPYVNVGIPNTATGTVSDTSGRFRLVTDDTGQDHVQIMFSAIGYHSVVIQVNCADSGSSKDIVIILRGRYYEFPPVEIIYKAFRIITKGKTKRTTWPSVVSRTRILEWH